MTSLKELKKLAEAAIEIEAADKKNNVGLGFYGASQAYQALAQDLRPFHTAANPATILKLISALEKYEESLNWIQQHSDCENFIDCDHEWQCDVSKEALTQVQKIMEGK